MKPTLTSADDPSAHAALNEDVPAAPPVEVQSDACPNSTGRIKAALHP